MHCTQINSSYFDFDLADFLVSLIVTSIRKRVLDSKCILGVRFSHHISPVTLHRQIIQLYLWPCITSATLWRQYFSSSSRYRCSALHCFKHRTHEKKNRHCYCVFFLSKLERPSPVKVYIFCSTHNNIRYSSYQRYLIIIINIRIAIFQFCSVDFVSGDEKIR